MNSTLQSLMSSVALSLLVIGCTDRHAGPAQVIAASAAGTTAAPVADKWLGNWNGPEGTFLRLVGGNGKYDVTIQNLDGPRSFRGNAVGDRFEFERDGVKESVRATNGVETGMKWLGEKSDCLTVHAGEGYCRD